MAVAARSPITMSTRYALIVANDEYEDPKLKQLRAPIHDAQALARVLGDPTIGDFDVQLEINQPEHVLRKKVNRFLDKRQRDDTLLLHFSCHGLKDDSGQLFFAAADTEVDHLEDSAIESEWLRKRIDASRSEKIILLLDCCFSGAFSGRMRNRAGDAAHALEPLGGKGTVVLTASSALEFAWEGDTLSGEATPSVFTSELVRGLETGDADRDCDQWIAIGELYDYIYDRIIESGAKQTPGMDSNVRGELIVARNRREPPPVELRPEVEELLESPVMSVRMTAIGIIGPLLQKSGRHAPAAREALVQLRDDPDSSIRVSNAAAATLAEYDLDPRPEPEPEPVPSTRLVHDGAVMGVAFSPDGRWLATACGDQTARVWSIASATEHRRFSHDDWVLAAAMSPDAKLLATACRDGGARIWNVESSSEEIQVRHDGVVWAVAFSPDGRLLATAGADATVRLWDVDGSQERDRIDHDTPVVAVGFSPDGRLLVTAGTNGMARICDLVDGRDRTRLHVACPIVAVSFDHQSRVLAAGAGVDGVHVWDVNDARERFRIDHERTRAAAFASDGRSLATGGEDGTGRIWDTDNGNELAHVTGCGRVRAIALSHDGRWLAVAGGEHAVTLWRAGR